MRKKPDDAPDLEEFRVRALTATVTLPIGWYLGYEILPERGTPRQVVVTLLFWGVLYFALVAGNLATKLKETRERFKSILGSMGVTPDKARAARREMEVCFEILTMPYEGSSHLQDTKPEDLA